jgi:glycosyltransferase involved in cell wall biosynthesis
MLIGPKPSRRPISLPPGAPLVTVVIPSYNQGRFLEATLRSIFTQSIPVEVMLADGGSTDNTLSIVERWRDRLSWFRTGWDAGQASAINEGISYGRAPFVCWLNSDDIFLPGGLLTLLEAIETDDSNTVAYGNCLRIDEFGHVIGKCRVGPVTTAGLSRRCVVAQSASIIRRQAWERIGGLNETLHFSPDYDLWWRLHRSGARFYYIANEVAAVRLHAAAKTIRNASEMYAEAQSVVLRHHGSVPLIWSLRKPFSIALRKGNSVLRIARQWKTSQISPLSEADTPHRFFVEDHPYHQSVQLKIRNNQLITSHRDCSEK